MDPVYTPCLHTQFTYRFTHPVCAPSLHTCSQGYPPHPTLAVSVSISTLLFLDRLQKPTLCICIARTILQLLNPPTLSGYTTTVGVAVLRLGKFYTWGLPQTARCQNVLEDYIGFTYPKCKFGIQVAFQRRAVTSDHPRSFETARCQDVLEDYIGFT